MDSSGRACTQVVGTGWSSGDNSGITGLASRVFHLWGMANAMGSAQSGNYTLSLTYSPPSSSAAIQQGKFGIITRNANGSWINAVDANFGGTKNFVLGPWTSAATLGTYGVDTITNTAWAVINFAGDFAVVGFDAAVNSQSPVKPYISVMPGIFIDGNRLVLPVKYAGKTTIVEFFNLSGQLIFRAQAHKNFLNIAGLKTSFKNREVIVKCISGNTQEVQKIFVF